ncbi:carbon-nitrogen hydrolase family protein [Kitasatospora sp. NPDC001539]|uniref:carbon-nitrogen hydrolase family protein n=1 Tax=Kitasatospora sp. NPDC001539 TaxID=3154384 RepID=UPI0033192BAB
MKIAAAQLTCTPADIPANVRQLVALAEQARAQGAELIVFPELVLTGYELDALSDDPALWVTPDDARLDTLRSTGIATVINCAVRTESPRPGIGTFVYGTDGELITTYLKQHLYETEQSVFTAGDSDGRFAFGGLRFALATCFDNHIPDLVSRGATDGCDVHLASSLYGTGDGIHERATLYPGIAKGTDMHVVLANHVGPAGSWTGCGGAALWAPGGTLLTEADGHSTTVAIADVR